MWARRRAAKAATVRRGVRMAPENRAQTAGGRGLEELKNMNSIFLA
jgi:hypothetical protein